MALPETQLWLWQRQCLFCIHFRYCQVTQQIKQDHRSYLCWLHVIAFCSLFDRLLYSFLFTLYVWQEPPPLQQSAKKHKEQHSGFSTLKRQQFSWIVIQHWILAIESIHLIRDMFLINLTYQRPCMLTHAVEQFATPKQGKSETLPLS